MLNKPLALSLVAATMLIAPAAAFAGDQEQYNEQTTYQNGAAINGGTNVQTSETRSYQEQIQINGDDYYNDDYYRRGRDDYYRRDRNDDYYYRRDRDDDYYYGR
ncbi:hypothetical protein [Fischerella sp. JS2]|uniref:hypothetical protein n=1 Tax=Fischerella sp. JS2 TaxID=2597771 RepID=UPI0028EAFF51|nr:hypothetical protein [Fischerella sp. JS2]